VPGGRIDAKYTGVHPFLAGRSPFFSRMNLGANTKSLVRSLKPACRWRTTGRIRCLREGEDAGSRRPSEAPQRNRRRNLIVT